jgi:hypothetical protein
MVTCWHKPGRRWPARPGIPQARPATALWPVGDRTATRIAADVYTYLTDSGEKPSATARTAVALHHATRRVRRRRLGEPTLWAAHIHVGV